MSVTLLTVCDDIADFFDGQGGLNRTQRIGELTEGMNTYNTLQVYPQNWSLDAATGIHQTTYRGEVKQGLHIFHMDLYGRQRSNLGEDWNAVFTVGDALNALLEGIKTKPYFNKSYIKAFTYTGERVLFSYGDPDVKYVGIRWVLSLWIY